MSGDRPRTAVGVGVDQFLYRSAMHAALAADGRFDAHLCPLGEDAVAHARECGARMLIASRPVCAPDLCVVTVSHLNQTAQIAYRGDRRDLISEGLASLCNQLAAQADILALNREAS